MLLPLHPRTRSRLPDGDVPPAVHVAEPVGYIEMIALETACERIATDSGGVQKEALWAGVPCVTLREETEWVETVEVGWNTLVGADAALIEVALKAPPPAGVPPQLYGDGTAGVQIADIIADMVAGMSHGFEKGTL